MIDLKSFFEAQLPCWPLAKANYDNLEQALFKDIYLSEHERIRLVCLPARIASSSAKIKRTSDFLNLLSISFYQIKFSQ